MMTSLQKYLRKNRTHLNISNGHYKEQYFKDSKIDFDVLKIKYINLESNSLKKIDNLHYFVNLKKLILNANCLTDITYICDLTHLNELDLSFNYIKNIPDKISTLTNLKILKLNNNQIFNLRYIFYLFRLKYLNLSNNIISYIPDNIKFLRKLVYLNLNNNKIELLPKTIINLYNLNILYLSGNKIYIFPNKICEIKNLKYLDLSNNHITTIPKQIENMLNLKKINLYKNRFWKISSNIYKLKQVKILLFDNNNYSYLPRNIIGNDIFIYRNKYIKPYIKKIKDEYYILYMNKIIYKSDFKNYHYIYLYKKHRYHIYLNIIKLLCYIHRMFKLYTFLIDFYSVY